MHLVVYLCTNQGDFMKRLRITLFACASLLLVSILLIRSFGGHAADAAPSTVHSIAATCGSWSVVPSANVSPGQSSNTLSGIATISSSDAWAVGNYTVGFSVYTLTEHWNGNQWSIVPSPNVKKAAFTVLTAVTEISSTNAWAVGYYYVEKNGTYFTLIEHWDGSNWHIVASPSPSSNFNYLFGVTAISANDIWAVGTYGNSSNLADTLVEHWNGSSWSVVASPNSGTTGSMLESVSAISSSDIWAVGFTSTDRGKDLTLTEHWDGSQWSIVASPNEGKYPNSLKSVTAVSSDNVWAVGVYQPKGIYNRFYQTLTEHWDGSSWSVVPSPNVGSYSNTLISVAAVSANTIWAVGSYNTNSLNHSQALIEQWNGSSWSVVPSPVLAHNGSNYLDAAAVIPGTSQLWAVGIHIPPSSDNLYQTLTEHYC